MIVRGPLQNFGIHYIHDSGAILTRSAEPSDEGWQTLFALWATIPDMPPLLPRHYALNGSAGPAFVETVSESWSVLAPDFDEVLSMAAMVWQDLCAGRHVHVNCSRGEDRTGELCAVVDVRRLELSFDDAMARRAPYLSTPFLDSVMDLEIVETIRRASEMPR